MRRQLLRCAGGWIAAQALGLAPARAQAAKRQRLVLAGPFASVSFALIRMIESGTLSDLAETVEFRPWKDPDQLRALALDAQSPADFIAMPSNVAANLYNRGVRLQLLNVATWGVLWMVSREAGLKTLADFKGKEIVMPFRADMPDIVFQTLVQRQGLDARRDFKLRYVGTPLDAMQLLITRRADHALLAEPAISVALRKTQSFPVSVIAPQLHRSVNLQQEWGRVLQRPARIAQAGMVATGRALGDATLLARFQQAYASALQWCEQHPEDCGRSVARRLDLLTPEAVADSIRVAPPAFVTANDARTELEFFFSVLHQSQPALIGGKLPDAGFYAGVRA